MTHIQELMSGALAGVLRRAPLTPEKVGFAWRLAVGPAMASVTTVDLRATVLHVSVRDRAWQREVRRAAPLVLTRLTTILGDAVARLDVTVPSTPGAATARSR